MNDLLIPSASVVGGASIQHIAGGISAIQTTSNTGQGFDVTNPNARNGDLALTHLRFNDPIGGMLLFSIPTTGYTDPVVKYATRRSGQGAGSQFIEYSTDGTTFVPFDTIAPVDDDPTLQTIDFSSVVAADNNPDFKIRIGFSAMGGGTGGNNRFDNFTCEGTQMAGGTDTTSPSVVFTPLNNAVNQAVSIQAILTFNEDIRLLNNDAINNTNAGALAELRLNNSAGALVPFDASFAGRVITIVPTNPLANNQTYYLALKANVVEDLNDNAIDEVQSILFTTIARQTQFQAGDLAVVAYRMNAASTEDEIALLTFVDILPGTMIQITDAKYTTNANAQCPGGLTWTAPASGVAAGTVIAIQNDASVANIGSLTGSGFGLSSGGDQVMVYTGNPTTAMHITALSSNNWLAANTSCSGSNSMIPATLADGVNAINLNAAPGNVNGNTVNAYYNGIQDGTIADLKTTIFNPANWIGVDGGTAPQVWPAWAFPGPPSVVSASVFSHNSVQIVFSRDLDNASALDSLNYTGIQGISSITKTNNGILADTVVVSFLNPFISGGSYSLVVSGVKDTEMRTMFGVFTFNFSYNMSIGFEKQFMVVSESDAAIEVRINLVSPSIASADLVFKSAPYSTASSADITYTTQTLSFTGTSANTQTITIPIVNDNEDEQDEYIVLSLENLAGCTLTGDQFITIYITDNDRIAPLATQEIELSHIQSFKPGTAGSSCEIVVHDPVSQRLFMTSAIEGRFDIADFSNPSAVTLIKSVDMSTYGGVTSVDVKNGIVAVASPDANEQLNGSVVFFDVSGNFLKQVTVGALPDMVVFSPDGNKVLTANEGQPNLAYTVDPEGSVSVIDISGGINNLTQANVTTLLFDSFNAQEEALISSGVRKLKLTSTLSQDFEPEFITVSEDSKKAWVTLQENNAIAEINLENTSIASVWALGTKDYNAMGNGFDASDKSNIPLIANWPVKAFFIPDAVASYSVGGTNYIVMANEGDEKEYDNFEERTTVGASGVVLDPAIYPHASVLKKDHNLGRLRITNLNGRDSSGIYNQLYVVGSRSFSIFNADSKAIVYDSGDDFERITSADPSVSPIFNADNEDNVLKGRSRAKGPEPEGITIAHIADKVYAFITLERVGGVMVYNITDPSNVTFVDYKNTRSILEYSGDQAPEGVIFISGDNSPNGKSYIVVSNEISGTVSIFELLNVPVVEGTDLKYNNNVLFNVYPNPNNAGTLYFNKRVSVEVMDVRGQCVMQANNVDKISTSALSSGMYLIKNNLGESAKVIIE